MTESQQNCYNLEAERCLLGALLLNNRNVERLPEHLKAHHFVDNRHSKIFTAVLTLVHKGHVADPITLKDYFSNQVEFDSIGGAKYLLDLCTGVTSVISVTDYGLIIYDLYLKRQLITLGEDVINEARTPAIEMNGKEQIEAAERKLYSLATEGEVGSGFKTFKDSIIKAIETAEIAFKQDSHIVGVTTGLVDLDKWLGGLHTSDLLVLAGRPAMGKTALATNIAFNAALAHLHNDPHGTPVAFFSLEMSAEQLALRLLASESGISSDKIRRGEIRADDFPKFIEVSQRIYEAPLFIDDTPAITVMALRNRCRRLQRQHGLGLVVIDYLQLLEASSKRSDNRVQELTDITRGLKALAKELNVPVLALSQLSRAVEQRDDKRPLLADLRESGSIEQDADVVMFVYREEYYEKRKEPPMGTDKHIEWCAKMDKIYNRADVIIAKQRHGPVGTIHLFFNGSLTKFDNLDEKHVTEMQRLAS
jgi:replicative DNA helicase